MLPGASTFAQQKPCSTTSRASACLAAAHASPAGCSTAHRSELNLTSFPIAATLLFGPIPAQPYLRTALRPCTALRRPRSLLQCTSHVVQRCRAIVSSRRIELGYDVQYAHGHRCMLPGAMMLLVVARPHCAKTCAVIGFPNGTSTPAAKAAEASELVLAVGYAEASLHRPDSDCRCARCECRDCAAVRARCRCGAQRCGELLNRLA